MGGWGGGGVVCVGGTSTALQEQGRRGPAASSGITRTSSASTCAERAGQVAVRCGSACEGHSGGFGAPRPTTHWRGRRGRQGRPSLKAAAGRPTAAGCCTYACHAVPPRGAVPAGGPPAPADRDGRRGCSFCWLESTNLRPRMRVRMSSCDRRHSKYPLRRACAGCAGRERGGTSEGGRGGEDTGGAPLLHAPRSPRCRRS
jgi:hypothetical protein